MVPAIEVGEQNEQQKRENESVNSNESQENDTSSKVDEKKSYAFKADTQESDKGKEKREKNRPPTKIVIRRLPPSMNEETFLAQVDPLPDHNYLYFVRADMSLASHAFSRAYINITNEEDIFTFKEKFDNYIFVDKKGTEYPAVVEFAPYQRLPKQILRKDIKVATIDEDPTYLSFLKELEEQNKEKANTHACDYSYQPADYGSKIETTTPLLEFLKNRRAEKQRIRDERREERRRKEIERKKMKDEEKRKKRPDGDSKQVLRNSNNDSMDKNIQERDGKLSGDRKRDDDKPKYKTEKKISENRSRDRHERQGTKPSPKSLDGGRSTRKPVEEPRLTGDEDQQRKRFPTNRIRETRRGTEPGNDVRKHVLVTDQTKQYEKPYNKERGSFSKEVYHRDNDPRRSYSKESVVRRTPREKKTDNDKPNEGGESKGSGAKRVMGVERKPLLEVWNDDQLKATRNYLLSSRSDEHNGGRRFSLEVNKTEIDSHVYFNEDHESKPLRVSADDLNQLVKDPSSTRMSSEEYKKDYHSKLYSTRYVKNTSRQTIKPITDLPTNMTTFLEFIEKYKNHNSRQHQEHKMLEPQRRNSLESSEIEQQTAKGFSVAGNSNPPPMRRNLSLELDCGSWDAADQDRSTLSRETSIESSSEDRKEGSRRVDKRSDYRSKKDPREERRIRNKDRPSIEIYRPGMGRFSRQRIEREKEQESSQSPSPTLSNRSTNIQKRSDK